MKNKQKTKIGLLAALAFMAISISAFAVIEPFKVAESSKMVIKGTSSVHDWESEVTEINGTGTFNVEQGKIVGANNVQITIPVKSIKSGKNGMDSKTYEALNADKTPSIQFQLNDIKSVEAGKITATGVLTIAGTSKPVTVTGDYEMQGNQIVIKGSQKLNMKNFNVSPPTAMFGAIKAGEEVTIDYELVFLNK